MGQWPGKANADQCPKYGSLVWDIELISLIKRDKSCHIFPDGKYWVEGLGQQAFPNALDLCTSCQDHSQPLGNLNPIQMIKIIFLNGQFWLILISLASHGLICTRPSLLWRLQAGRANGKEKWSSICGFVTTAQPSSRMTVQPWRMLWSAPFLYTYTPLCSIYSINPWWGDWESKAPLH